MAALPCHLAVSDVIVAASGAIACAGSGMVSRCFSALACATMRNALESFRSRQNDSCA